MKRSRTTLLCLVGLAVVATTAQAQPSGSEGATTATAAGEERPGTDIRALIERLSVEMDKEFIVPDLLPWGRLGWSTAGGDADYETLLGLLRIHEFVAIETADQVYIVPDFNARSQPSIILNDDDRRISDHTLVTRIVEVEKAPTAQLIPMLRPMMPQSAQLTAVQGTTTLVLVDRYDNVRRLTEIIETIDDAYPEE